MKLELATRYHKALLAGQEEVKDYKTWFENYRVDVSCRTSIGKRIQRTRIMGGRIMCI